MTKPTEIAENRFKTAQEVFVRGMLDKNPVDAQRAGFNNLQAGLVNMADGLHHMSIGLRATYNLLEEVKGLIQRGSARP